MELESSGFSLLRREKLGILFRVLFGLWLGFTVFRPVMAPRPLGDRALSWGDEWPLVRKEDIELGPFSAWNITGTYRGTWIPSSGAPVADKMKYGTEDEELYRLLSRIDELEREEEEEAKRIDGWYEEVKSEVDSGNDKDQLTMVAKAKISDVM